MGRRDKPGRPRKEVDLDKILMLRDQLCYSWREIGAELGVSPELCRLRIRAINGVKTPHKLEKDFSSGGTGGKALNDGKDAGAIFEYGGVAVNG
jgi:hypothetical protein